MPLTIKTGVSTWLWTSPIHTGNVEEIFRKISEFRIVLKNTDFMQHNLLVIKPGSTEKVGTAADALEREPNGAELQYVPKLQEVLFHTPLVNPPITLPDALPISKQTGDYPYVCTFPGHWKLM